MEVAGLGIGIAGLVGLFSSCLEAIDKVKDYKSSTFDPDALNVQFDAERLRLQHWGCNVGLELENGRLSTSHHERLNDNKLRSMVEDLLRIIHDILKSDERFDQSGNGKAGLSSNVASSRANQPRRTRERVARSRTSRVIWARGGGQGRPYSASYAAGIAGPAFVQPGPPDRERTQRDQRTCPMRGPHKSLVRSAKPWGQERNSNMNGWSSFSSRFKLSGKVRIFCRLRFELTEMSATKANEAPAETRREIHARLLGQRYFSERYDDSCKKRLHNTCGWIFTRPTFAKWCASGSPELLWIYGRPGFGKTILCSRIIEHISATFTKPVAYFFLSSDHKSCNDPYNVMRSWVSQLAAHSDINALLQQKWQTTTDQAASRATIVQLLREALQTKPGCSLIVDGLDECTAPADSNISVARFLEDVLDTVTSATRVLIVSREETEIRQPLQTSDASRIAEYQILSEDVYADNIAFSQSIVIKKLPKMKEENRAKLSKTMSHRCEGQFLWLHLQERSLKAWKNIEQLQRDFDGTPTGLDHL